MLHLFGTVERLAPNDKHKHRPYFSAPDSSNCQNFGLS
jgi:hypothetical protein